MSGIKLKLSPTKQRKYSKIIFGYDIETYNENKDFYCSSLYSDDTEIPTRKTFYSIQDFIEELKTWKLRKTVCIATTNLSFDFFGTFFNTEIEKHFKFVWRGSNLLSASTYIDKDGNWSSRTGKKGGKYKIEFIDTMNFAMLSVEKQGNILGIPKLNRPKALGKLPKDKIEKEELITYNLRDSEITYKFMKFLNKSFYDLGATPKITIASTSMSLFRNVYLKDTYWVHDIPILDRIMKGYYGGRTEVFSRGFIENYNYYDVNSLYPSVMLNKMPDPNTIRFRKKGTMNHITGHEGFSEVKINCPDMKYPLLPVRYDNKLIFPTGTFKGWYSHLELRKAIAEGYVIMEIYETIWFKETCEPFKEYVTDLYSKRKKYKAEKSPMEKVVKLCLNSLYGKFAQSFRNREKLVHKDSIEIKDLKGKFQRVGDYFRIVSDCEKPAVFCFPEWSAYITSYARIKLYDLLKTSQAIYCDTDSIITKTKMPESDELGELKLECFINEGYIIKPKFYIFRHEKGEIVKIKGVMGRDLDTGDMIVSYQKISFNLMNDLKMEFTYKKIAKFRESLRRGFKPNSIQPVIKVLDINDTKRIWDQPFNCVHLLDSVPYRFHIETDKDQDNGKESYHPTDHNRTTIKAKT